MSQAMAALDRDTLLAIGVGLVMFGIFLRGFAASSRRDLERRRQHLRDDRRADNAGRGGNMELPPTWFEKNLGLIANLALIAGAIVTTAGFLRHD
jgi:hypothetical protein